MEGGKCLVNWKVVCQLKSSKGLGFTNLAAQSIALKMRWIWYSWTDSAKSWIRLPLTIDNKVRALFNAFIGYVIGDGAWIMVRPMA